MGPSGPSPAPTGPSSPSRSARPGTRAWTGWYHRVRWLLGGMYRLYGGAFGPT